VGSAVAGARETGLAVGVGPAVEKDTTRGVGVAGPPATVAFTGWLDEQLEVTAANASQRANPPIVRQTREFCIFPLRSLGAELKADVCRVNCPAAPHCTPRCRRAQTCAVLIFIAWGEPGHMV
jgi:hypothetical protein